jgi:hypothetical protein
MGRVAKYKKIKSFDPYSKKNKGKVNLQHVGVWGWGDNGVKEKKRSKKAELLRSKKKRIKDDDDGFDLPPDDEDEFDMKDVSGSVKKQRNMNNEVDTNDDSAYKLAIKGNVATIPKTDKDERKFSRSLKLETQMKKTQDSKMKEQHARMEGESKRAYAKRTKVETRQIIKKTAETNPEKRQKKKDFLNNKKKSKKRGSASMNGGGDIQDSASDDDGDRDTFVTGERAVAAMADPVRFGEQAERPPVFRHLPRGAKAKEDKAKAASKSKGMTSAEVEREKGAMELMRRKVQAQYAVIKLKRRKAGDFHL